MTFRSYGEYKETRFAWIDRLPIHWQIVPLRHIAKCLDGCRVPLNAVERSAMKGQIPYWGANCVVDLVDRAILDEPLVLLGEDGAPFFDRTKPVAFYSEGPIWPNNHIHVLRPAPGALGRFLVHALNITDYADFIQGSTRDKLTQSAMAAIPIPFPGIEEQAAVVEFLDRETAKIDALVEEQRQLIELLKEKRQAVISQAVTKGLDPNVPMKYSGVEWLGEVPAHWTVLPLKRFLAFLTSGSRGWADHYSDDGALFVRIGNLTRDGIDLDLGDIQRVDVPVGSEGARTRVSAGDLLFSITAYLGSVAVAPRGIEEAYVSQHVALARLDGGQLLPEWAAFVAKSYVGMTCLALQGYGGTKVQLSLDDVAGLTMLVPPMNEQLSTLAYLRGEVQKLEELTQEAAQTIDLLQERRSALISAAVTGKIDVRGLAPQ
jgi:type I restriction enzyme S subunit